MKEKTYTLTVTELDEIDRWIVDNFGIMPGACSSTENLRYNTARMIAEGLWPKWKNISQELEEAAVEYSKKVTNGHHYRDLIVGFIAGANWQKEQDKETIELAEDHAYFAGKEKMREALLEWAKSFTEPQILVSDLIDKINEV